MRKTRILACTALAFLAVSASSQRPNKPSVVSTFAAPDANIPAYQVPLGTYAIGITPNGTVVGYYADNNNGALHGFIRTLDGTLTKVDVPAATVIPTHGAGTILTGMNSWGEAAGYYYNGLNNTFHGFIRSPEGLITTIDIPGESPFLSQHTFLMDINESGTVLGYYRDSLELFHPFLLNKEGEVTAFDVSGQVGMGYFCALNNPGAATGTTIDQNVVYHGWIRSQQGMVTIFDAPGAGTDSGQGTIANGLNDDGTISGTVIDANNISHGMLRDRHGNFTVFDVPGSTNGGGTSASCINASGTAVGYYWGPDGIRYGFARTAKGIYTKFDLYGPGTGPYKSTYITGINNQGWLTGWFQYKSFVILP